MEILYYSLKDLKMTNAYHQRAWRFSEKIACYSKEMEGTRWIFMSYLAPLQAHFNYFMNLYPNFREEENKWHKKMTIKDDRVIAREFRKVKCPKDQIDYRGSGNSHSFCFYAPADQIQLVIRYFETQAQSFGEDCCLFHQIDDPNDPALPNRSIFDAWRLSQESEVSLQLMVHEVEDGDGRGKSHSWFGENRFLLALSGSLGAGLTKVNDAPTPRDVTHWTPNKILTPSNVYIAALVRLLGWCCFYPQVIRCLQDPDDLAAPKWGNPNAFYHYREELLAYKQEMETRYPFLTMKLADFAD